MLGHFVSHHYGNIFNGVSRKRVRGVLRALARVEILTTPLIKGVKLRVPAL